MARTYWQYAITAVKQGISANESLTRLAAAGQGIRRSDWLALMREAREELARNAKAYDRQGNRRPYRREIFAMTTTGATGYLQHVDIWVKDKETGEIFARPYSLRTDDLMTHDDAVETALDRYEAFATEYGQSILGAAYGSTYELVPGAK